MSRNWTPEERAAYMRPYQRERYEKKRAELVVMLGGKCARCGSVDLLEFDHIDPSTKTGNVTTMIQGRWSKVLEEIKKCQLLCGNCHDKKSAVDYGPIARGTHGTWQSYKYCGPTKCDQCRIAWRIYCLGLRRAKGLPEKTKSEIQHGTEYGYSRCVPPKCEPCKKAHREERARYKLRVKTKRLQDEHSDAL